MQICTNGRSVLLVSKASSFEASRERCAIPEHAKSHVQYLKQMKNTETAPPPNGVPYPRSLKGFFLVETYEKTSHSSLFPASAPVSFPGLSSRELE